MDYHPALEQLTGQLYYRFSEVWLRIPIYGVTVPQTLIFSRLEPELTLSLLLTIMVVLPLPIQRLPNRHNWYPLSQH